MRKLIFALAIAVPMSAFAQGTTAPAPVKAAPKTEMKAEMAPPAEAATKEIKEEKAEAKKTEPVKKVEKVHHKKAEKKGEKTEKMEKAP